MDYAAAPIQPIVQGLLTVAIVAGTPVPSFEGKGVSSVIRTFSSTDIIYTLILDEGLPGNAGELQPGPVVTGSILPGPQPDARTLINIRGSPTNAIAGGTSIVATGVSYGMPSQGSGGDGGYTAVFLVFTDTTPAAVDPMGAVASGVEIIIWKGLGGGLVT
jgi:hypothetical protein